VTTMLPNHASELQSGYRNNNWTPSRFLTRRPLLTEI
jgi:hypothetical protein